MSEPVKPTLVSKTDAAENPTEYVVKAFDENAYKDALLQDELSKSKRIARATKKETKKFNKQIASKEGMAALSKAKLDHDLAEQANYANFYMPKASAGATPVASTPAAETTPTLVSRSEVAANASETAPVATTTTTSVATTPAATPVASTPAQPSEPTLVGRSSVALPEIYIPQEFDVHSRLSDDPTRKEMRQHRRYLKSTDRYIDQNKFYQSELDKYRQSVEEFRKAALAAQQAKASTTTPAAATTSPSAETTSVPAETTTQATTPALSVRKPKTTAEWTKIAQDNGFADMGEVLAWQEANGLEADGKFGDNSSAFFKTNGLGKYQRTPKGFVELSRQDGTTFLQKYNPATVTSSEAVSSETPSFDLMGYAKKNGLNDFYNHGGKKYVRHDPFGAGDYLIGEDGKIYKAGWLGKLGNEANASNIGDEGSPAYKNYHKVLEQLNTFKGVSSNKRGGIMNRINYFQQGGAAQQPAAQDMQQQVVALVQAAMQGDKKATDTVNQIMEAAKAGDQQAMQIAQMIQQVAQQMQGQAASAKLGAKLGYIKSLKYARGGKTCPACEQKVEMKKCGGKKAKKKYFGGIL